MEFAEWLAKEEFLGKGLHGFAFSGKNGQVVKFTKSKSEAALAKWIQRHPHPNIAKIYSVNKTKNGWKIVVERVNTNFPGAKKLENIRKKAEKSGAKNPAAIAEFLEDYRSIKFVPQIISILQHMATSKIKMTDFLNPNNMGHIAGAIKLFDFS